MVLKCLLAGYCQVAVILSRCLSSILKLKSWQAIRNLAFSYASLIMQSQSRFTNRTMHGNYYQSIPEKNLLVEFHSRRFENISCDRGFKLEMVLKLSELLSMRFSVSKILNKSSRIRHTDLSRS